MPIAGTRDGGTVGWDIVETVPESVECDDRVGDVRGSAPVLDRQRRLVIDLCLDKRDKKGKSRMDYDPPIQPPNHLL